MASSSKKRSHNYAFHEEWEEAYFFVNLREKCVCLICHATVAVSKKSNVERHFVTLHKNYDTKYPSDSAVRREKVKQLKSELQAQQDTFRKPLDKAKASTVASFSVAHVLAKKKKTFEDGETVKECWLEASESLFENFKNKAEIITAIKSMPLSGNTVTRRIEMMAENVFDQIKGDLEKCTWFSLQFDESTDVVDTSQLSVFVRMVFSDDSVKEDFLVLLPLKGKTRGADVYQVFKSFVDKVSLPLQKLVSVTTDGAPSMIGSNVGFVALCKNDPAFPQFISYHCIIHQQVLCSKVINYEQVMKVVVKIINSIRARPLQHRLFKALLDEVSAQYGDLLLYTEVRWLSRGKVLQRFEQLIPEIKSFLQEKGDSHEELDDPQWLADLAFLTDITSKLNELNLELQGQMKTLSQMISSVNAFINKLKLWMSQISKGLLQHFPSLQKRLNTKKMNCSVHTYTNQLNIILDEFKKRFADFSNVLPAATFISNPFCNTDVSDIASQLGLLFSLNVSDLEIEIITLQSDLQLRSKSNHPEFWALVMLEKFPLLKEVYQRLRSCFGSTYMCESGFSTMKILKSKYRSRLTDSHLNDCMRMAVTNYTPEISKLAEGMQSQPSH